VRGNDKLRYEHFRFEPFPSTSLGTSQDRSLNSRDQIYRRDIIEQEF
jgi:hypothetical protein